MQSLDFEEHSARLHLRCLNFPQSLSARKLLLRGETSSARRYAAGPSLAIVGTRRPTPYAREFLSVFLPKIAQVCPELCVVSGGAFGVDTEAHVQALRAKLTTHAWVVGPIASPSPRTQHGLYERMLQTKGCAIWGVDSLEPALTGRRAQPADWLRRNAWLVAASDAVVVVEATLESGTHSSVNFANNMGIPVYILPGRIDSPQSQGTNQMISMGCGQPIEGVDFLTKRLLVDLS